MKILSWFLDLLYPPKCVFCGKLLEKTETDLCEVCREELPRSKWSFKRGENYRECFSVFYYENNVRKSIVRFKFDGQAQFSKVYAKLMAMVILENRMEFDLLTWVPISKERLKERGYSQAKLLADEIGAQLGVEPVELLKKIKNNEAQSSLKNFAERRQNVKDVYRAIGTQQIEGKHILLIDDVITSGATLSECSRMLKNAGAKSTTCVTLAATRD